MKQFFTIVMLVLLFTSCSKDRLTANGDGTITTRQLSNFTGIRSSGANPITVNYGDEFKVELKGSSNLIPYFKTEVVNSKVYLNYENASVHKDDIEITVTLPVLKSISLSGSGKVIIDGDFPLIDFFNIDVSGSGKLLLTNHLNADDLDITISGSGEIVLDKLAAKRADISISGSGDARLKVQNDLKANISGSGKVYYLGNPIVTSRISGSGKIIQIN